MKKIIYSLLGVVLISGVIYSCKKDNNLESSKSSSFVEISDSHFKNLDYVEIGEQHNQKMIQVFNFSKQNGELTQKELAMKLDFGCSDKVFLSNYYDEIKSTSNDQKHTTVLNALTSQNAKNELNKLRDILNNSLDYSELCSNIENEEIFIKSNFTGLNYGVLMTYCEITKHSAYLWFGKEVGGSGQGDQYIAKFDRIIKRAKPRTRVESDVLGGATSMVSWAVTGGAVFGPFGALGGFAAATILGAAFGSI